MKWKLIPKTKRVQGIGVYSEWKQQISDDCFNQCVYCSIHESPWGGIDHYHIDHYRPKSKFVELEHVITNLYHACPICNRFKSDDWPDDSDDLHKVCYPDPCEHNYSDLFELDPVTYHLSARDVAPNYVINRLYLNRPQLIYERREFVLRVKAEALINDTKRLVELSNDIDLIKKAACLIADLVQHLQLRADITPYRLKDIKKQKK
jgi:hypothetical protein